MPTFAVFLELHPSGLCAAHVPDLPGLYLRADSEAEALDRLPEAIRAHCDWLRRQGEPVPDPEPITLHPTVVAAGGGPFSPGDPAALLPPDRLPPGEADLSRFLRLSGALRAELLALTGDLPDELLDWQPDPQGMSLRRILRHVGNAEQWYVSRVTAPETLPPEWEHDDALPIFEFLEMERRTTQARLRALSAEERARVFKPAHWPSSDPDELWTARKALRRTLEHELEHTAHARQVLAAWRLDCLAGLAAARAELLWNLARLEYGRGDPAPTLTGAAAFEDYTPVELLAHVAAWDALFTQRIELALAGRWQEIQSVELDERNAALHAEHKSWPPERALEACLSTRRDFLGALARLSDEQLHRLRRYPWGAETSVRGWVQWRGEHDAAHAAQLAALERGRGPGSKSLLLAAVQAAREELLAAAALVPVRERETQPVCGEWTLKDVLGHIADWEAFGAEGLWLGRAPEISSGGSIQLWNEAHAAARRSRSWDQVWADSEAAHAAFAEALAALSPEALAGPFPNPFGYENVHAWALIWPHHEREHAAGLREAGGRRG